MPQIEFSDIFGGNYYANFDVDGNWYELVFVLNDFQNVEDEGEITGGLGITDLATQADRFYSGADGAVKLLYSLLLMLSQKQADNINADPEQKVFISDGGKRFASGSRAGQIQRVFNVNFFYDDPTSQGVPDIDEF